MRLLPVLAFVPGVALAERGEAPPPVPPAIAARVKLEPIARRLDRPLLVTFAPGDPRRRLFIVEQDGRVKIWEAGAVKPRPFVDVADRITRGGEEQGLLGMAFHPRYAENGRFYLHYSNKRGDTRVVERRVSADPDRAGDDERVILAIDQPWANHNGGHVIFGPDGKLWIGMGDGGAAGDPKNAAQDPDALLGKMLRLDPDRPEPEIVARGLRNPWRYAFDRRTGDLYIGDVGQGEWEEIHVAAAGKIVGQNFGWRIAEGTGCYRTRTCRMQGLTPPVVEYPHPDGCSVTGGVVYRGKALPELDGVYFYADYCTGLLRSFRWQGGAVRDHWDWKRALDPRSRLARLSSFGEDEAGELYLLSLDGVVYKLVRQ